MTGGGVVSNSCDIDYIHSIIWNSNSIWFQRNHHPLEEENVIFCWLNKHQEYVLIDHFSKSFRNLFIDNDLDTSSLWHGLILCGFIDTHYIWGFIVFNVQNFGQLPRNASVTLFVFTILNCKLNMQSWWNSIKLSDHAPIHCSFICELLCQRSLIKDSYLCVSENMLLWVSDRLNWMGVPYTVCYVYHCCLFIQVSANGIPSHEVCVHLL